jgi:hypothetical protein
MGICDEASVFVDKQVIKTDKPCPSADSCGIRASGRIERPWAIVLHVAVSAAEESLHDQLDR